MNNPNTTAEPYDLVVLGSGEAGKIIAWTLAKQGKKAAVIERRYLGGSCPNIACLPSKNLIHSAKVASYLRRADEFGIRFDGWNLDMPAVRERKRRMIDGLLDMHRANFEKTGAELVMGSGRFIGPKEIEVTTPDGSKRVLSGERVVINTGTRARIDDTPGLRDCEPLTHIEALELDVVPEHLIVQGGGYVGLELAQAMRRFGSRVTVIERNDRLVRNEDEDVTAALAELLRDEGIDVLTGVQLVQVEGTSGTAVTAYVHRNGEEIAISGSHLLAAAGHVPNTADIGLESAGVELTERGYVKVDDRLATTVEGVWAVGDCAGSPQFTHIGFDDFRVLLSNFTGGDRVTTGRQVPFCMFTDPELARVGLNERQAAEQGIACRIGKVSMAATLRTRTLGEERGFMKVLIEADGDRILGFTMFGVSAGEVLAVVQVAMLAGIPYTALRDTIFTHPTMPEGLIALLSSVPAR